MTFKIKHNYIHVFATVLALSCVFSCASIQAEEITANFSDLADFSSLNFVENKPVKLTNPIYLDVNRVPKSNIQNRAIIPQHLRSFSESDYFSSSIDEIRESGNNTETQTTISEEQSSDFFAPTPDTQNTGTNSNSNVSYTASIDTNDIADENTVEGRPVVGIKIAGLKTLTPDIVLSTINTRVGSKFNPELLQQDLQKIFATGYFTDEMAVEPTLNPSGTIDLQFYLQENIAVSDVSVFGNTVISTIELMPFISNMKGKPQNLLEINRAIDKINEYYHKKGYILASISSVDDTSDGALSFSIREGIINKINIEGNEHTKNYVIERNIMTLPNSVYNEEYLKKDLTKIYSSQIFDEVDRKITPTADKEGYYDITVIVKEKSTNSIAIGGGIDTGLGAFGSLSFHEDNFLGRAQRVSLSGIIGSGILLSDTSIKNHMNYQFELSFFEPYFLNADNSLMSKLYYRNFGSWGVPLAIEKRLGADIGIEHKVFGYEHLSTTLNGGIEHIHLKEGDFNRISQLYAENGLDIKQRAKQLTGGTFFNISPGIRYSTVDTNENPREGIIAQAHYTEAISVSNFKNTNGRVAGAVTRIFPIFKQSSLSLTAKAGTKAHGDNMPEVMAYRLGGPYSIRGFKMNGVGSGESFVMGTAEVATPIPYMDRLKWDIFHKMRFTFFVDAGRIFEPTITSKLYDRPLSAITAGVGLRVYVPGIGPISVDYGIPLTNPGHYGSKGGYFTFGSGDFNMYGY